MTNGKIDVGFDGGIHIIRFTGDVRMTLCASLERYLDQVLRQQQFYQVVVDLAAADGVDSTTLGQIAKVALICRQRFDITPTIYSPNESITRILLSMGFDHVFNIMKQSFDSETPLESWLDDEVDEETARRHVIDAHRALIEISDKNKILFTDLVKALESGS